MSDDILSHAYDFISKSIAEASMPWLEIVYDATGSRLLVLD